MNPTTLPFIRLGHDLCSNLCISENREWMVTNGLGGYAAGTVSGILSRSYHGYLIAALNPPVDRTLMVGKLEETISYRGVDYDLSANRWVGGTISPQGYLNLEAFWLEGAIPCWCYNLAGLLVEKRLWMEQGSNTTYVQYRTLAWPDSPVTLKVRALANYRDHHAQTRVGSFQGMEVQRIGQGVKVTAYPGARPYHLCVAPAMPIPAQLTLERSWYQNFHLAREQERGLGDVENHLHVATWELPIGPYSTLFILSTEAPPANPQNALDNRKKYEQTVLDTWKAAQPRGAKVAPAWVPQAVLAADQFLVERKYGLSIIAGYPWFNDWGRDAMISLPGLTLTTGRYNEAKSILRTFAQYLHQGLIPNNFADTASEQPGYNTVDGTLWFVHAVWDTYHTTGDLAFLADFFPHLEEIISWHNRGTLFGIKVDPKDDLLWAGESGVQLTWMDARVGDKVITPRMGKAVEINALWYEALLITAKAAEVLKKDPAPYQAQAVKVRTSFQKFYHPGGNYLFDVIDGPEGNDPTLRPNQIFALSLPHQALQAPSLLSVEQCRGVLSAVMRNLLTTPGLRSLPPSDSQFVPVYAGSPGYRDGAYHQGTVWAWLTGPFVEAHMRTFAPVGSMPEQFLHSQAQYMAAAGLGTLSEIFDATAPFASRGCPAQAWSISELLRAWHLVVNNP